ncbi:MAG: MFS transporter [Armatimonadetes bacterium]|nr:MFS transporter [Candidatus Hippobium faecium]
MNKLLNAFLKDVPPENRENYIRDCFGNICTGVNGAFFINFFAVVAKKYLDASSFELALITSSIFFANIFSMIISGLVPPNKEHKFMALGDLLGSVLFIVSIPFIKSSVTFTVIFLIFRLFTAYAPLYVVTMAKIYNENVRPMLMGRAKCFYAVTSVALSAAGGWLINTKFCPFDSWRVVFIAAFIFYSLNAIFCYNKWKLRETDEKRENPFAFLKNSFLLLNTDTKNTWLIVSGFLFTFAFVLANTLAPIFQVDVMGISTKEIGILLLVQNLTLALGYPLSGKFIGEKGPVNGWIMSCILGVMLPLGYILVSGNWIYLCVFYAFNGFFMAVNDLAWMNLILLISGKEKMTQYQSLHYFFIAIRGIAGMLASTWLIDFAKNIHLDYRWVFSVSGVFFLGALGIVILIFRKNKRSAEI